MKNILFIAPPAGGKGTQSDLLVENLGYIHISTGDLLRELDKTTPLGIEVDNLMKEGKFVSDEIIFELLKDKLSTIGNRPLILDGVPRNINQAIVLDDMLNSLNLKLDMAIYLEVPYEILMKRATGRLTCPNCKATFNKFFKAPKSGNICDRCKGELVMRNDDSEETFKTRFDTYQKSTEPLIDYYKNQNKLVTVDGVDNVYENIVSVITND